MINIQKELSYQELQLLRNEPINLKYQLGAFHYSEQEQIYEYLSLDCKHKIIVCSKSNCIEFIFFDEIRRENEHCEYLSHLTSHYYESVENCYGVMFESIQERNSFLKENAELTYYKRVVKPLVI